MIFFHFLTGHYPIRHKEEITKLTGIEFTLKSLRHTFNQNLMEAGVPDIVRASWMGHSKPTTTNKIYTHNTNSLEKEAIKKLLEKFN